MSKDNIAETSFMWCVQHSTDMKHFTIELHVSDALTFEGYLQELIDLMEHYKKNKREFIEIMSESNQFDN